MPRISIPILVFCLSTIPVTASASGMDDVLTKMDASAPKYQTPECQAARQAAGEYSDQIGGRIALGAILGATLGVFGLPIAAAADLAKGNEAQRVSNNLLSACGLEAFFPIYMDRAKDGHADAEAWVGMAYERGYGCPKDLTQSVYWYQKAVDDGEDQARVNLGAMYYTGEGVPVDTARAIALWQDAADDGQAVAQKNLADLYIEGKAVPQDYEKALKLLKKSAKQGHASAQFEIGRLHEEGKGEPQSDTEAYKWYSIAAASGFNPAVPKRDALAAKLTPEQLQDMNKAAEECQSQHFLRCEF